MTTRTDEERLKALAEKGWTVNLYFSYDGWNFTRAYAGDCNCGHAKEYDPADGHGHSDIGENDIPFDDIPNWTPLSWWLDRIEERVEAVKPGAPWPPRPKPPAKQRRWWQLFK